MLPVIDLDLEKLCRVQLDQFETRTRRPVGVNYTIVWDDLLAAATREGASIDALITAAAARGFATRPIKSEVLIWYGHATGHVIISASSRHPSMECGWIACIPRCRGMDTSFVNRKAKPFMLWDGARLHRLHALPPVADEAGRYVVDFGDYEGLWSAVASRAFYERVKKGLEDPDFSAIPRRPKQQLRVGDAEFTLQHTFYRLG